ncbi:MAG TPA: DinB family protein [Bryobacteraceae bacterium]|nr:DinB family protein [Bryobacteraceae bacterium]
MNRFSMTICAVCASLAAPAMFGQAKQAPPPQTEIAALKASYAAIKNNVSKAADQMPENEYSFKASPDIRTFGELIGHIADAQARFCAIAGGTTPPNESYEKTKTAKADLVAALKSSFDTCDSVFNSLSDDDISKMVTVGRGSRSKTALLWTLIIGHSNEEYGYLSVYMRLKGHVPPSSQR